MFFIPFFGLICVSSANRLMLIERNNEVEVMAHAISDVLANFAVDDGFRIDIRTRFYQSEHLKDLKDASISHQNRSQVLVYGHGVKIPSLNVVGTFFGIGQTKLPDLSFSRFILMIFILFCLIIRTAYQGVLFELMTSQPRRPEPKDIQGLIDQNYTVLVWHSEEFEKFCRKLKMRKKIGKKKPRFVKVDQITFENIYKTQFNNGSAKLSLILQHQTIPVFNQLGDNYIPWIQLEESYQTLLCSFVFFPNHFLYQLTNDAVQRLTSAGIMQHLYDNYIKQDLKYEKKFIEESEPQVFALSDLDFGFYVWLGTCAVAIFVFLIELFDLGEVYENDAVEVLSKELFAPFSNDKNVTEITTEDINEIEEIKIESRRMSEIQMINFAKIHPTNDSISINDQAIDFCIQVFKIQKLKE
ncbi:hypothetical protein PVAND_009338 [Polypedilum vanderplanki]|uniref:Ionotropic glutamate receptor C-terminal domain-containing protein n=1 Tax=Polypedilum vanderplanki TaxID=319348 RepID=A0A9J6CD79_POLVA|nr:hypothetical protein PVAND_009338 [Polypedilum vanderplanki]